jgi:hypothetical protein
MFSQRWRIPSSAIQRRAVWWKSADVSQAHITLLSCKFLHILQPTCPVLSARGFICFRLVSCVVYMSKLKMEAICTSVTSVDIYQTTRHYIPQDTFLHITKRYIGSRTWILWDTLSIGKWFGWFMIWASSNDSWVPWKRDICRIAERLLAS